MGVGMLRRYHKAAGQASGPDDRVFPEGDPSESWKVDELKAYASAKEIDLGGASRKADMVAAIEAADGSGAGDDNPDEPPAGDDGDDENDDAEA